MGKANSYDMKEEKEHFAAKGLVKEEDIIQYKIDNWAESNCKKMWNRLYLESGVENSFETSGPHTEELLEFQQLLLGPSEDTQPALDHSGLDQATIHQNRLRKHYGSDSISVTYLEAPKYMTNAPPIFGSSAPP